jgi:transcriptional regulator with XRE-family HTH domain
MADPLYIEFGRLVREHRRRLQLTQVELGRRIGLTRTSITNIESGRQKVLLHQVFLIAKSLGVTADALLPSERDRSLAHLEEKLPTDLTGSEREWVRRVVASGGKDGGARHGKD